jgi:hypothetical protein
MTGNAIATMNDAMSRPASDTERLVRGILGYFGENVSARGGPSPIVRVFSWRMSGIGKRIGRPPARTALPHGHPVFRPPPSVR